MATRIGDLFVRLRTDDRGFKSELTKQGTDGGAAAGDAAGKSFGSRFKDTLARNKGIIGASIGAGVANVFMSGAQAAAEFEQGMNEVFTLLPNTTDAAFEKMKGQVKDFSNEWGVLPNEVIPALYQSLSAGIPEGNVFEFLEQANKAAKAGAASTDEAVGVIAGSLNAWGLEADKAERVSDALFTTVRLGVTTFPELSQHMNKVSSQASVLGIDIEDVGAAIAALTKQGQPTEIALTNLAQTMTLLQKGTPELERVLDNLGYANGQAALDALGFQGTLEAVRDEADRLGIAVPKMTGRVQAANAIFGLTGEKAEVAQEILGEFTETTGATEVAFEKMDRGIAASANRIAARIQTMLIDVGGAIAPIAPILVAAGPGIGRAMVTAFGAGFGFLATKIPMLLAPVVAKIGAVMGATTVGQNIMNSLGHPSFLNRLRGLGGGWGKALGFGAAAVIAVIIAKELEELNKVIAHNRQQQQDITEQQQALFDEGLSRADAEAQVANLKAVRDGLDGVGDAVYGLSEATEGIALVGNVFDALAGGEDVATFNKERLAALEAYLATDLPEQLAGAAQEGGEEVGEAIGEGISESEASIAAIVDGLVADGILQPLEDGSVGVAETFRQLTDDALSQLADGSTRDVERAFAAIGEEGAHALAQAVRTGADIPALFADLPEELRVGLEPLVPVVQTVLKRARKEARHEAALMGVSLKEGIKSGRQTVRDAMADLRFAMVNPLKAVKVIAKIEGALTSKRLRAGLKSGDPLVKRQAELTKAQLIEEWEKLTGETYDHGKSTSENLGKGIKARRQAARKEARQNRKAVKEEHAKAPADAEASGEKTSISFARGIRSFIGTVIAAAKATAAAVADNTQPGSPTKTGPLSKEGGIEGWGERLTDLFAEGLSTGFDPVTALGLEAISTIPSSLRSAEAAGGALGGPVGGETNINLKTYGLPIRARTPLEVSQQLRRAARLGQIQPTRTARYAEGKA